MKFQKEGEPQPVECYICNEKRGYSFSDYMKTHYITDYNSDGSFELGSYSDYQPTINNGKTPYCMECQTRLKFKLDRS